MHATFILSALALALPVYSASSETVGCYSEIGSMKSQGPFTFQSPGHCEDQCSKKGFKIAALGRGDMCYCGDQLPSQSAKVDDDQCDIKCSGWPEATCKLYSQQKQKDTQNIINTIIFLQAVAKVPTTSSKEQK